jgi:hypothetical protein
MLKTVFELAYVERAVCTSQRATSVVNVALELSFVNVSSGAFENTVSHTPSLKRASERLATAAAAPHELAVAIHQTVLPSASVLATVTFPRELAPSF